MSLKLPNITTSPQFPSPDRRPALVSSSAETRFNSHKFNSVICVIHLRCRSVNETSVSHVVERCSTNGHVSTGVRQWWLVTRRRLRCANVLHMIWIRRPVFPNRWRRCWVAVDEGVLYLRLRPWFHLLWLLFLALSLLEILTRDNTRLQVLTCAELLLLLLWLIPQLLLLLSLVSV